MLVHCVQVLCADWSELQNELSVRKSLQTLMLIDLGQSQFVVNVIMSDVGLGTLWIYNLCAAAN